MKPSNSPLQILDFALTKMDFNTILPSSTGRRDLDIPELFNDYPVDVDFFIESKKILAVRVIAKVNYGPKKLPGYSFYAEAGTFFYFDETIKLTKEQRGEIEGFSSIYIGLNVLRGLISSFTANAPFGRYILPSINLNELIATKQKEMQVEDIKTKTKPVSKKTTKLTKPAAKK